MPRQNLNVDVKIVGRKCKVRKRGCSSSSSSSFAQNYRLKRAFLVGKRRISSTPVPVWKMTSSNSPENDDKAFKYLAAKGGDKAKDLSVSARKLGATLWEINALPSPSVRRGNLDDKISEVGILEGSKSVSICLSDPFHSRVSEGMDRAKAERHRRRSSCDSAGDRSPYNCLVKLWVNYIYLPSVFDFVQSNEISCPRKITSTPASEVDEALTYSPSPCKSKTRLKDVYNGLKTSKELLKVLSRVWRLEEQNSAGLSIFSALKSELDRACVQVNNLIEQETTNKSDFRLLFKQFAEEKALWKIKERDRIHSAIKSMAGELEVEKKMRRQSENLNKKLGRELSRARKELEKEKAEFEEMKFFRQEMENEREMLHLADALREERVQMKLSEAKFQFEEKNAVLENLRNELEARLANDEKREEGDKIKELKKYLKETLPNSYLYNDDKEKGDVEDLGKENEGEDDSCDSDQYSIELNIEDLNKRNDKRRIPIMETNFEDGLEWEFAGDKQENLDVFDRNGLFEFSTKSWKRDTDDDIDRYNMIKDLRDNIVSGSRMATTSQDLKFGQQNVASKDASDGMICRG